MLKHALHKSERRYADYTFARRLHFTKMGRSYGAERLISTKQIFTYKLTFIIIIYIINNLFKVGLIQ